MENNENLNTNQENISMNSNLTNCKACGAVVSKNAPNCPKCGNPIKKKRKGLGCAIGCLTPILLIILLIVGINISGNIKEYQQNRKYDKVVNYIKENGVYDNGTYMISANVNKLLNLKKDIYTDYTIYACVDKNDNIYFSEFIDEGSENVILVRCNREKPHKGISKIAGVQMTCEVLNYYDDKYSFSVPLTNGSTGVVKENHSDMIFFSTTLNHAERLIDSFDLGVTVPELYDFE